MQEQPLAEGIRLEEQQRLAEDILLERKARPEEAQHPGEGIRLEREARPEEDIHLELLEEDILAEEDSRRLAEGSRLAVLAGSPVEGTHPAEDSPLGKAVLPLRLGGQAATTNEKTQTHA